jgi:hypothetical protein
MVLPTAIPSETSLSTCPARSRRGTQVAAIYYSLVESAKLSRIDPATNIEEAARPAIVTVCTVTLPHDLITH